MQLRCTALPLPRARRSLRDPRKERWSLKLTRHNGRAGKHGTYNPKHNDRSFEIANSEHIDPERVQQNIYWDCYNGIRSALQPKSEESLADTFEEVEKLYYKLHYTNFTERQNERNAKIRHTERNRSTEDLLASKKTCPEESIYQLGTLESHASPKELFQIATEFMDEFHERFGKHVHILDWALHLDEGTPHIHERHVFDCENKYGEIAPQQEKALEALGFELPKPDKPLGRYNNRKITFDAACRTMLFEIAKRHGLELDEVPEYGGRAYLEKQDYILKRQNERIAEQKKELQEQSIQYVGLLEDCRNQRDEYDESKNSRIELLSTATALALWIKDSDPYTEHPIAILNYLQSVKRSRTLTSTEQAEILSLIEAAQDNESIYVGAYLLLDNPVAAKIHFDKLPEESQKFFESCPIYHFMPNGQPTISAPTEG